MKGSIILPEARVELCVADNTEVRYYLKWPYLDLREPDQPMLVATDGHKLLAAPVKVNGDLKSCPLPLAAFEYARRGVGREMHFDGDMCGTSEAMFRRPDHDQDIKYPLWRNVAKDAPTGKPDIGLSAKSLDTLHKALDGDRFHGLSLAFTDANGRPSKSHIVRVRAVGSEYGDDVIAVIMPMRLE